MAHTVLHLIDPPSPTGRIVLCLTEEEKARATRFVQPSDAERWSGYRAGLRRILGKILGIDPLDVPLIEGAGGKPALAAPHQHLEFNLSHTNDLAVVVTSTVGPVGIDIEPWSRAPSLIECDDFFCHPEELKQLPQEAIDRASRLLEIWTAKEALLKAIGTGLTFPPSQLRIIAGRGKSDSPLEGLADFRLLIPDHPDLKKHRVAIAVTSTVDEITWSDAAHTN